MPKAQLSTSSVPITTTTTRMQVSVQSVTVACPGVLVIADSGAIEKAEPASPTLPPYFKYMPVVVVKAGTDKSAAFTTLGGMRCDALSVR